jgi:hypothetical protein
LIWINATRAAYRAGFVPRHPIRGPNRMSVTHPAETFAAPSRETRSGHEQLAPFLLAVAMFAVVVAVALWFTGLPQ